MLTKREVSKASPDLKEMRRLYNASFPDDERIPFHRLLKQLNEDRKMYAYYEGEELVGLSYLFFHEDLVYLSYICIEESLRDKGYGSEILQIILEDLKDSRIALDIEEVKEGTENEEERKRRKAFYLRNGFVSSGVFYHIYHVDYEILCAHGEVKKEDWHALIRKHWGSFADTAVYY